MPLGSSDPYGDLPRPPEEHLRKEYASDALQSWLILLFVVLYGLAKVFS